MNIKILMVLIVAVLLLAGTNLAGMWSLPGTITPIYCQYFEYIGCVENPIPTTYQVQSNQMFLCPTTATRCEVQGAGTHNINPPYIGEDCVYGTFNVPICDRKVGNCNYQCTLSPGQWFVNYPFSEQPLIRVYEAKLSWCGTSPCAFSSTISPVQGSSGCNFVASQVGIYNTVYDENGNLIDPNNQGIYTVPQGVSYQYTSPAFRRICGNQEEWCDTGLDCANQHTYKIQINNEWYGVEFASGQMQFYGCINTGNICVYPSVGNNIDDCLQYNERSWCGVTQFTGVECLPGTDSCGPNAACQATGPTSFECVPYQSVECNYDWECGQAISCDRVEKELKQPYCNNGMCDTIDTPVDCCYDSDCADGYYCDSDYSCKQEVTPKVECPYSCCIDEMRYFDKPCPPGQETCCGDHTCAPSVELCNVPPSGDEGNWNWVWIIILAVLLGSVGYLAAGEVGAIIGGIAGGIAGYAVYWFMSLALWQQWLIGIAGVAGAGILLYVMIFGGGFLAVLALIVAMRGRDG